ncbi:hypothetical protein ACQPZF_20415 [Actinosynnema sp. CS-041913]|uniref:hypothetical protein n=1 Tax=Actinosynnema sp. CS-041913 TaxID=3239917 RepID=UPI003D8EC406
MSWGTDDIVASMALHPDADVEVRLRSGVGRTVFLSIGSRVEITLRDSHALALRRDIAAVLGDMELIDAADKVADAAYDAGAQARRAAVLARERAAIAERGGDSELAERLRQEAGAAVGAADTAQAAADAAAQAMDAAEDAAERITRLAAGAPAAASGMSEVVAAQG